MKRLHPVNLLMLLENWFNHSTICLNVLPSNTVTGTGSNFRYLFAVCAYCIVDKVDCGNPGCPIEHKCITRVLYLADDVRP